MLTKLLLMRIDQATYGCICEYPTYFENETTPRTGSTEDYEMKTKELYRQFNERFRLEIKPRKMRCL